MAYVHLFHDSDLHGHVETPRSPPPPSKTITDLDDKCLRRILQCTHALAEELPTPRERKRTKCGLSSVNKRFRCLALPLLFAQLKYHAPTKREFEEQRLLGLIKVMENNPKIRGSVR